MSFIVNSITTVMPQMLPGVTFTPPAAPTTTPPPLPGPAPTLNLDLQNIAITVCGDIQVVTQAQGVVIQQIRWT